MVQNIYQIKVNKKFNNVDNANNCNDNFNIQKIRGDICLLVQILRRMANH
jgi:hypothetical protein